MRRAPLHLAAITLLACVGCAGSPVEPAVAAPEARTLRGVFVAERPAALVGRLAVRHIVDDGYTRVTPLRVFAAGEAVRFEITANRAARFQILHATDDGPLVPIWPPPDDPAAGALAAHGTVVVPPAPQLLVFDSQPGVERFRVVLTAAEATRATRHISQITLRSAELDAAAAQTALEPDGPLLYFEPAADGSLAVVEVDLHHE